MKKLKEYSQRYEGKQIWLTEFAIAREPNVTKIVEFVEGTLVPNLLHVFYVHDCIFFH